MDVDVNPEFRAEVESCLEVDCGAWPREVTAEPRWMSEDGTLGWSEGWL